MTSAGDCSTDAPAAKHPIFEHGEELAVINGGGLAEFRSGARGEFIKTNNAVYLSEMV